MKVILLQFVVIIFMQNVKCPECGHTTRVKYLYLDILREAGASETNEFYTQISDDSILSEIFQHLIEKVFSEPYKDTTRLESNSILQCLCF